MFKINKSFDVTGLQERLNQLHNYYMPLNLSADLNKNKKNCIKEVKYILKHYNKQTIQKTNFVELLRCTLALVYYFGMRLKLKRLTSKWFWCSKRQFHKTEVVFKKTLEILHPERGETVIRVSLEFFSEIDLWPFESFTGQILEVILFYNGGRTNLFNAMLTDIHAVLFSNVITARHRMRILYNLFKSPNWIIDEKKLLPLVTRLLDFFYYSIDKTDTKIKAYSYLRKGFEVCLRRIFERVENSHRFHIITTMLKWFSIVDMSDDDILEFSSLLDDVAKLYEVGVYSESFSEGVFEYVLSALVGSSNALHSLIGCKLIQIFLDRKKNAPYLMAPSIYYEFSQVRLKKGCFDNNDKAFIRQHRQLLHDYILKAVQQHYNNTANLKALFSVICIVVLEVPCGLTAAAAACLLMAIQDFALNGENLLVTSRYWIHAIVISIMSLICWVHKAPMLYRYVNQIICRRAKEAPQLNPPLMQFYNIGRHHVTWNKPTLFFEDWELRYGLWKHFQDSQPKNVPLKVNAKKVPVMDLNT